MHDLTTATAPSRPRTPASHPHLVSHAGLALLRQLSDRTEVSRVLALGIGQLLGDVGRYTQTAAAKITD